MILMTVAIISASPPMFVSGTTSRPLQLIRQPSSNSLRLRCPSIDYRRQHHVNRFDTLNSRCWMKNNDIQVNYTADDEEDYEDTTAAVASCSVPVVGVNCDTSEHESGISIEDDGSVDGILIPLPILLDAEWSMPLTLPAHPAGLYALYTNFLVGNMVEQLWNYAWPTAIALVHPSLLPVAVISFCTKLAIIIGGPSVGKLMDHFPRLLTYNCLSFVQVCTQLISVTMIILAHRSPPTSSVLMRPWFTVLVFAEAVERLSGSALGVAVERDWVVLLAGPERSVALARANAVLSRIDLLSEIAGASLFGFLLSKYDPVNSLKIVGALVIWTLPIMVVLAWLTDKLSSGVLDRAKPPQTSHNTFLRNGLDAFKQGWLEYLKQPVLPASLAFVLLYFNIVLSPSSLMTAFLTQRGVSPFIIGAFSGLCAFMGIAATFVSATLVRQLGVLKAGATGLVLQALLLTVAVMVYWAGVISRQTSIIFFLCLIVLSRLGHMSYDIVGAQILQTGTPSSKANLIGITEVSVASLAEFMMLGVAIVAKDASKFGILAALSLSSVVGAAWMFCRWLRNSTDEQKNLFS